VAAGRPPDDRHLIPRWRSVRRTVEAGEFQRLETPRVLTERQLEDLERTEHAWRVEQTVVAATEFLGACAVAGEPNRAKDAAELVRLSNDERLATLVQVSAGPMESDASPRSEPLRVYTIDEHFRTGIASAKRRLIQDPRDMVAWADSARRYTALGHTEQAAQALRVARALAPTSRYLLRVTARFLVHTGRPDAALRLLQSSPRTASDPWLMAASLSVASAGRIPLTGVSAARKILENDNFREIERSELAAELATVELASGADKKSRRLFERSMTDPTDNSLAQAEWASHRLQAFDLDLGTVDVPFASEATCRSAVEEGEWSIALAEAMKWLDDQPFDAAPAAHASYVAAVGLDDWESSSTAARLGLRANPEDATLRNNLAYALIEAGELAEASTILKGGAKEIRVPGEAIALQATQGLLEFRSGQHELGRDSYGKAIETARRAKERDIEAMARSMQLCEEIRIGQLGHALDLLKSLEKLNPQLRGAGVLRAVRRANELAAQTGLTGQ